MRDPYEVLGVRKGASKEEIKRAYLELVRKYHPDKFKDNPLRDLAEEKLKEINEAYNILMNDEYTNYQYSTYQDQTIYQQVRDLLVQGRIDQAERILTQNQRNEAEWFFLMGLIYQRKGYVNQAYRYFIEAYNREPNNFEYKRAKEQFETTARNYEWSAYNRGYRRDGDCDICTVCQIIACWECCCDNDYGGC